MYLEAEACDGSDPNGALAMQPANPTLIFLETCASAVIGHLLSFAALHETNQSETASKGIGSAIVWQKRPPATLDNLAPNISAT